MKRFSNILLVVDKSTDYSGALKRAVALARNNQSLLTICTVADTIPGNMQMAISATTPTELHDIAVNEKRVWLDGAVKSVVADGVPFESKVLVGKAFIEIIRQVLENNHDLVMKCAASAGDLRKILFGSTDMHLMRKCPCPVWIIKPTEYHRFRRIMAAVDRDPEEAITDVLNRQILEMSTSLAVAEFSEAHVVHAWDIVAEDYLRSPRSGLSTTEVDAIVEEEGRTRRHWLENLVKTYGSKTDKTAVDILEPQLHVIKGDVRSVVPEIARELEVDLVVMGTVARAGIAGFFMGNTAENILTRLDCSVLTIKPPEFISPVTPEKLRRCARHSV